MRALRKATRLDARNAGLWVQLGDLYGKTGQGDQARKAYQTALSIEPGNRQALDSLKKE